MMFFLGFILGLVCYYLMMQWAFYLMGKYPEILDEQVDNQMTRIMKKIRGKASKRLLEEMKNPFDINV